MRRRWQVNIRSKHFKMLNFTPRNFWTRRGATKYIRFMRAMDGALFDYALVDTRTGTIQ